MDNHKVKGRGCRLDAELDAQWEAFLETTGMNHSQAIRKAIAAYINNYYPKEKQK